MNDYDKTMQAMADREFGSRAKAFRALDEDDYETRATAFNATAARRDLDNRSITVDITVTVRVDAEQWQASYGTSTRPADIRASVAEYAARLLAQSDAANGNGLLAARTSPEN